MCDFCTFVKDHPGKRPRKDPNPFIFAYVFTEKHPHRRSVPQMELALSQRETLDPHLNYPYQFGCSDWIV